jgi:DNA-binding response OmpR family regulator
MMNKPYNHDELGRTVREVLDYDDKHATAAAMHSSAPANDVIRGGDQPVAAVQTPMQVLVFDDDNAIGQLLVKIAIVAGMEATAVTTAETFWSRMRTDRPEVIVLDLTLADTDGEEQMRLLADWRYTGALVLMSGFDVHVLAAARAEGSRLGLRVEDILEKPLSVGKLVRLLKRLRDERQGPSAASPA